MEADIGRWKEAIGHALRSQTGERQATEVAIAVDVLNRMLEWDARGTSASHETQRAWDHCVRRPIHATRSAAPAPLLFDVLVANSREQLASCIRLPAGGQGIQNRQP